jgi:hypothetical protein
MRRNLVLPLAVLFAGLSTLPAHALTVEPLQATRANEFRPAASERYLAWTVERRDAWIAYAKAFDGDRVRVSAPGWEGAIGGISGHKVVYQQFLSIEASDIFLYDLRRGTRKKVGAPVSTNAFEYDPTISRRRIAFGRWHLSGKEELFVYNRRTGTTKRLAVARGYSRELLIGQLNGRYLAWEVDFYDEFDLLEACHVYLHDFVDGTTSKIPNPGRQCQYGPSVDVGGRVYYGRSSPACGVDAAVWSYPIGGPAELLFEYPVGTDFGTSYAVDHSDGSVSLYLDPADCSDNFGDIARLSIPSTP